jgi:hypothetical protein
MKKLILFFGLGATLSLFADPHLEKKNERNIAINDCTEAWREVDYRVVPFPDNAAKYLSYQFEIPKGKKIAFKIEGEFPVARYMSFHVYDQVTEDAISSVYDAEITPNKNSVNPYRVGEDRYAEKRRYTQWAACPDTKTFKENADALKLNCSSEKDELVDLWYRIYVNEGKLDAPKITAYDADTGEPMECPKVVLKEDSIATVEAPNGEREPAEFLHGRTPAPFKNGDVQFYHPNSRALGANNQVKYMATRLDGKGFVQGAGALLEKAVLRRKGVIHNIGDVTVLKFKVPKFPNTEKGLKTFSGKEEVRYWSLCVSGEKTDASNCLYDAQVKTVKGEDGEDYAVVVIGADDPSLRNEVEKRGFNFLHHSQHRSPILFYRQMLARPDFAGRIENVVQINRTDFEVPGEDVRRSQIPPKKVEKFFGKTHIGDYAPVGRQCYYGKTDFFEDYCGMAGIKELEKK